MGEINTNKKLAVIGSRGFDDYPTLVKWLDIHKPSMIVSGGAIGADSLANKYAQEKGLPILIFYPDWNGLGKRAGFARNAKIIETAEEVVAFWDLKSAGTKNSIDIAKRLGKPVYIYGFGEPAIKENNDDPFAL